MNLDKKHDVCVVCGVVENLNDMWVVVETKDEAANICDVCYSISQHNVKDFSALVYNNSSGISDRIGGELLKAFRQKFNINPRMARLWGNIRKKWKD